MGINQEHAAAAFHAAKMAQLSAMGHSLDKLPPGILPPHLDLSKLSNLSNLANLPHSPSDLAHNGVPLEPTSGAKVPMLGSLGHHLAGLQHQQQHHQQQNHADIRRGDSEPMDLGNSGGNYGDHATLMQQQLQQQQQQHMHMRAANDRRSSGGNGHGHSSGEEDNYSDDDVEQTS